MAVSPSTGPDVLSSNERWRRWEQRGRVHDARFNRRVRPVLWAGVAVAAAVLVFRLLQ